MYFSTSSGRSVGHSLMASPKASILGWAGDRPFRPRDIPATSSQDGPEALTPTQARDMLEIVEDRYDKGSLIITSQVPVDRWHDLIGIPTLADAILDRAIHNAYRIELAGESLRKRPSSS